MSYILGSKIKDFAAPLFIAWQINSICNLGCLHCCEEAGHSIPNEMNNQEIFNFLEQIVELKIPYVALSGGEPLLHPHLFKIAEFLSSHKISIKIETNGEFISEEIAQRFKELNFRSVQVSLDGATPEAHQNLRLRGNWQKAISAIKYLVKHKVNTEVVFVPTKFNITEVGRIIDLVYSLGVYGFYTGKIMRIGRAALNWQILNPTSQEYKRFFRVLEEKSALYNGKLKIFFYPYDVMEELKYRLKHPAASLLVIPNGKVKLIGPLPFLCGDLKKQSLGEVWENYKRVWQEPRVIEFAKKLIADPELLAESNKWVELYR